LSLLATSCTCLMSVEWTKLIT